MIAVSEAPPGSDGASARSAPSGEHATAPRTPSAAAGLQDRIRLVALTLAGLAVAAVNVAGLPYYASTLPLRVRHPLHPWLRSSGYVGQSLGLAAAVLFFFLWLYPLRKRFGSRLSFTGRISSWLDWHVAAGLLVPWLAATHAGWRFTGLIGLGYGALFVVYLSGLVGRYLYGRIPRAREGREMSRDEIGAERDRLLFELTAATGLPPNVVRGSLGGEIEACEGLGILGTFRTLIADDLARRRAARALARRASARGARGAGIGAASLRRVVGLARREMALAQQVRMLDATQRVFRYWHAAHKPFALTALLAVLAHIVVAVAVGATWFH